jgi:hypothetical protein
MTSVRPLFFLVVILFFVSTALAAGDGSDAQSANDFVQNQAADPALFGQPAPSAASDLFFLKDKRRLNLTTPAGQPRSALLGDADCYTMRMYIVKHKERFAEGENGLRRYSTCELASNYQVRRAIAHVRTIEGNDAQRVAPQK